MRYAGATREVSPDPFHNASLHESGSVALPSAERIPELDEFRIIVFVVQNQRVRFSDQNELFHSSVTAEPVLCIHGSANGRHWLSLVFPICMSVDPAESRRSGVTQLFRNQ